jgi:hypothetical protein
MITGISSTSSATGSLKFNTPFKINVQDVPDAYSFGVS